MDIFEDFFAPDVFETIRREVTGPTMSWQAIPGIAGNGAVETPELQDYGLACLLPVRESFLATYIESAVVTEINRRKTLRFSRIERMRIGLQTYAGAKGGSSAAHVDYEYPHWVLLVYLNDADGDTIFYDMMYEPDSGEHPIEYARKRNEWLHVKETVTPKANKAVLFDGMRYHSSSQPTKTQMRYVLNVNFTGV